MTRRDESAFSRVHTGASIRSHLWQLMWVRAAAGVLYQVLYCTCPGAASLIRLLLLPSARKTTFSKEKKDTLALSPKAVCVCVWAPMEREWKGDRERHRHIYLLLCERTVIRKYSGARIGKPNRFSCCSRKRNSISNNFTFMGQRISTRLLFFSCIYIMICRSFESCLFIAGEAQSANSASWIGIDIQFKCCLKSILWVLRNLV